MFSLKGDSPWQGNRLLAKALVVKEIRAALL